MPMSSNETCYHTKLSQEVLQGARYALLPGDPGRVEPLAKSLDNDAQLLENNREYCSYLAKVSGQPILICSTGIGGPSTSIAMEELARLGIKNFIRIGTCGAIQPHIAIGDIVISEGAVRIDGTSEHYAPIEYPAVADVMLTHSIAQTAQSLELPHHIGITASAASFYPGQERYDSFSGYVPKHFQGSMEEWQKLRVLNYEMESATVLTLARAFGLNAACFCAVVANRTHSEKVALDQLAHANERCLLLAKQSLQILMTGDDA